MFTPVTHKVVFLTHNICEVKVKQKPEVINNKPPGFRKMKLVRNVCATHKLLINFGAILGLDGPRALNEIESCVNACLAQVTHSISHS